MLHNIFIEPQHKDGWPYWHRQYFDKDQDVHFEEMQEQVPNAGKLRSYKCLNIGHPKDPWVTYAHYAALVLEPVQDVGRSNVYRRIGWTEIKEHDYSWLKDSPLKSKIGDDFSTREKVEVVLI